MFLILIRTIRESIVNFWRNGLLSLAAVSVLMLSLYAVGYLYTRMVSANDVLQDIKGKINVSVYFKPDVSEDRIMEIKRDLENYGEIRSVEYISKERALEDFKNNNADEPTIIQSLEEIGDNPLFASLVVKTKEPEQYEPLSEYIINGPFKEDISRMNYQKNQEIISKLDGSMRQIKNEGLVLGAIFGIVSILIIFNTIMITIHVHRQEIEVMRLVGASNMFIRLPFIFEGIIYGIIASLLSSGLLFATMKFVSPYTSFVTSQNLVDTYMNNFLIILGIQAVTGILLGVFSSLIAMRKHLKI